MNLDDKLIFENYRGAKIVDNLVDITWIKSTYTPNVNKFPEVYDCVVCTAEVKARAYGLGYWVRVTWYDLSDKNVHYGVVTDKHPAGEVYYLVVKEIPKDLAYAKINKSDLIQAVNMLDI